MPTEKRKRLMSSVSGRVGKLRLDDRFCLLPTLWKASSIVDRIAQVFCCRTLPVPVPVGLPTYTTGEANIWMAMYFGWSSHAKAAAGSSGIVRQYLATSILRTAVYGTMGYMQTVHKAADDCMSDQIHVLISPLRTRAVPEHHGHNNIPLMSPK
ncbi:hypothetical protein OS493_028260 [Desmophyllum pertusum]|uniref:Uncharacterized protein n=1 Tax=Desmophyllum pertusum TaxID=174260 RepID=A0A9X0CJ32_9CNID|nr:hypothetical protein OS493_028260 [Desmophyllum pertusum]